MCRRHGRRRRAENYFTGGGGERWAGGTSLSLHPILFFRTHTQENVKYTARLKRSYFEILSRGFAASEPTPPRLVKERRRSN